ncbi:MAG: hypothetical protein ABIQ16_18850 [Polyangiaceae bacterium]
MAARTAFVTSDATRERYREFLADALNGTLSKPVSANELWAALGQLGQPAA